MKITNITHFINNTNIMQYTKTFFTHTTQNSQEDRMVSVFTPCTMLHFTKQSLSTHRETCSKYIEYSKIPIIDLATTNNPTQPPTPATQETILPQPTLLDSCPPQFHAELQTLLNNKRDIATIYATVLCWNAITNTATNNTTP